MPTASKLAAAMAFALVAFLTLNTLVPHLPEGTQLGYAREISAAIGFAVGWLILGRATGRGYRDAVNSGLVTAVAVVFWALLSFSIYLMIRKSMRMMYDGPMEAVLGVFELMLEYGRTMLAPDVLGVLLVGGVLGGLFAEWASKQWR